MSEIRVTTLTDTAGGNASTSADIYSGRAKAWVSFNGQGAVAARASFNVNSVGDRGVGQYTINFVNNMPDTNFVAIGSYDNVNLLAGGACWAHDVAFVNMTNSAASNTVYDGDWLACTIFR